MIRIVKPVLHGKASSVEADEASEARYNEEVQAALSDTILDGECGSVSPFQRSVTMNLSLMLRSTSLIKRRRRTGSYIHGARLGFGTWRTLVLMQAGSTTTATRPKSSRLDFLNCSAVGIIS